MKERRSTPREQDSDQAVELPTLTFLIADDHEPLRAGIREALEAQGFAFAAEAADTASAVAAAVREQPDICLIDLDMPGNGLSAVAQIAKRVPTTTIIVLTVSAKSADLLAALERGASGYLLKGISGEELATTLRAAYRGEPALSRSLVSHLINQVRRGPRRRLVLPTGTVSLTAREWDVGELLRAGLPTEEIAVRLGVSPVTVRRHVALLLKKIGAPNRDAAVEALKMFGR
jgi:two-component system nitrate/nitrite response regulator NarL